MSNHKFKVGQSVAFTPGRLGVPASTDEYKVVRLLPVENGDVRYRIKSVGEPFERVVKESELAFPG